MRYFHTLVSTTISSSLLDAASEKLCQIFRIPVSGTVVGVNFRSVTVTTGSTINVQLQTGDATTGMPTGTLYHANATGTCVLTATTHNNTTVSDGFNGGTSWGSFTVTAGDLVALVIQQPAAAFGSVNVGTWAMAEIMSIPYTVVNTTGSDVKGGTSQVVMALEYNGGVYYPLEDGLITPIIVRGSSTWANNSASKEYGAKIVVPFDGRSCGVRLSAEIDGKSDTIISLYDSGGSLLASTPTINKNQLFSSSAANGDVSQAHYWTTPVNLSAGTYYVGLNPQTTTSIDLTQFTPMSTFMGGMPGAGNVTLVQRATQGSGAWTETTTIEPVVSLLFDQLARALAPRPQLILGI